MTEKQPYRRLEANVSGCADPKNLFRAIPPNDCFSCQKQNTDFTCWDCLDQNDLSIQEIMIYQNRRK